MKFPGKVEVTKETWFMIRSVTPMCVPFWTGDGGPFRVRSPCVNILVLCQHTKCILDLTVTISSPYVCYDSLVLASKLVDSD